MVGRREEFLRRKGWSVNELERRREQGLEVTATLLQRERDIQKQEREMRITGSRYWAEYKEVRLHRGLPRYLTNHEERGKNNRKLIARWRMGNEANSNNFWKREDEKRCRLCGEAPETARQVMEECRISGTQGKPWKEVLREYGKGLDSLKRIQRLREDMMKK